MYLQVLSVIALEKVGKSGMLVFLSILAGMIAEGGVIPLLGFHVYLISNGFTTKEKGVDTKSQSDCTQKRDIKVLQVSVDVRDYYREKGLALGGDEGRLQVILDLPLDAKPWDHGLRKNWCGVMGVHWWEWILPITPKYQEKPRGDWGAEFSESTKESLRKRARELVDESVFGCSGEIPEISCQNQGYPGVGQVAEKFEAPSIAKPEKVFLSQ